MEVKNRVPMCDITTFMGGLLGEEEQEKMNRHSTRNIGKRVDYNSRNKYKEDDIKEDDSDDNSQKPKLRKRARTEKYFSSYEETQSEDESQSEDEPQTRRSRNKYEEDDIKEDDSNDNSQKPKLRKRARTEKYFSLYEETQSEDESQSEDEPQTRLRKDKFSRIEDSADEDYDPDKVSDDSSGHNTKKSKEKEKPKTKRILTEYEKMVEKNREEKMAFLKTLKMDEVKESLSDAVKSFKGKKEQVKRVLASKPSVPLHMSLRVLQKRSGHLRKGLCSKQMEVDLSEEAIAARNEAVNNEALQKKLPEFLSFEKALQENYSYEDFNKEFGDLNHGPTKPFNEHVSHFETMQLPNSQIAKVVSSRITSMTFHPMKENILLAASSKYGQIGFWKVNSDKNSFVLVPHTEGITHLKFNPELPQFIVSSSYDGTLRCGDLEKAVFNEAYNVSEETSCTYFDFLSHSTFLVAQKNGIVSVVDHREKLSRAACKKHQCHDYSVKSVSVHPLDNSYFLSAGSKGTIKLWDLRKLQNQPIVEVQHHKRCVQSAFFSPLTGKHVLTTSNDDSICIFDSSNLGKSLMLQHSMKHNNQTGRWLTTFRSTWLPNSDDAFVVGSMLYPRRIEVYDDKMNNIFNFTHENLGCITSVNMFHPSLPVLAGANSSGKVYVFSNEDVS